MEKKKRKKVVKITEIQRKLSSVVSLAFKIINTKNLMKIIIKELFFSYEPDSKLYLHGLYFCQLADR